MQSKQFNILVVDDSPNSRSALARILHGKGFLTCEAGDGRSAMEVAEQTRPDAVFLDIMMPDTNRLEICRRLSSDPQLKRIPVIMCTAVDREHAVMETIVNDEDGYVVEPFSAETVLHVIRKAEDRNLPLAVKVIAPDDIDKVLHAVFFQMDIDIPLLDVDAPRPTLPEEEGYLMGLVRMSTKTLTRPFSAALSLQVDNGLARDIAAAVTGVTVERVEPSVLDVVGDITNMLAGNLNAVLREQYTLSLPQVLTTAESVRTTTCNLQSKTARTFSSNGRRIEIRWWEGDGQSQIIAREFQTPMNLISSTAR